MNNIFKDDKVNEIIVHQDENIFYEKEGEFFENPFALENFGGDEGFFREVTKDFQKAPSYDNPISSGIWNDFRVQVVSQPASKHKNIIQLRRISKLAKFGTFDPKAWSICSQGLLALKEVFYNQKSNFLIVGPTGSGKTTLLQSLLFTFSKDDRCLILEDTNELSLPNSFSSQLLTYTSSSEDINDVELKDLVKASLRLRPDRIIMGEMRGEEASSFLLMLSTGHQGSGATIHAKSPEEALYRIEMLVQMGQRWAIETIRKLIHCSIQTIIVTDRKKGKPYLKSIYQISGLEETGFLIHPVYINDSN